MDPAQNIRGMALLLAIVGLTSLGAITITGFLLARAERQAGRAAVARVQARGAADAALTEALLGWPEIRTPVAVGAETQLVVVTVPGPAEGTATLRSLGGPVFALHGEGVRRDRGGSAIGFVETELLVLLDSAGPDSLVRPRVYPRGWRILP
ncbi:MAG TPA: hypothetical protein VJK71_01045 [Gemmatimonadales bacterium]|nr:hypothetical protein [Gemmatimonadales bacterium]